jgi:hypothetical protein
MPIDLKQHSPRQLFELYVAALNELKERRITRSTNNPIADYAELLFQGALGLTLKPKSTKGHDAIDSAGFKYEIKGRRVTAHNTSRQLSSLRDLNGKHFDFLGGVLFNEDFSVQSACLIPHEQVLQNTTYSAHTNSSIFHLRDSVWLLPGAVDVTAKLQQAEKAYG